MKILIYGTGGVGGYFGARLAQSGNELTFIARGAHLKAMQQEGLKLMSPKGNYTVSSATYLEKITGIADFDLIIIAVKTWQLKEVARDILPLLSDHTLVLPLLNGVTNCDVLLDILPPKHVIGGLCKIVSKITKPGEITHLSYEPTLIFGALNNTKTDSILRLEKVLNQAPFHSVLATNIQTQIWTKFVFICTISAIGALTRSSIGAMIGQEEVYKMMKDTATEILRISKAKGIILKEDILQKQFQIIKQQPYDTTSSLQRDIMAGKPSELDSQNGVVVAFGKELGIPTPVNSFIYYSLLLQEENARKGSKHSHLFYK
ncbi:MAG: 2-dehydropantoate 2-reductase [Flavobacteriaceae bacterium]|nr:MAG: 2-dehydropantoate 2-reductase [Flavobacteriaceae bacterium]